MGNIYLIGMSGCGKTTVGKMLAERMGKEFVDTDQLIEVDAKASIAEIFSLHGEETFRDMETFVLQKLADSENHKIVSCGGGMPLRAGNNTMMHASGTIVYIERDVKNILACIDTGTRPLINADASNVLQLYEKRRPVYEKTADIKVSNNQSIVETVNEILFQLGQ